MPLRTNGGALVLCAAGGALSTGGGSCCGLGPAPCTYDIDCTDIPASPDGENIIVAMDTQNGCPWHVETDESWITLNPPTAHLSDGNVDFDVDANESPTVPRSGTVRVQTTTNEPGGDPICEIAVTQAANPASCAGLVTPTPINASGGPITVQADGTPNVVSVIDPWNGQYTIGIPCQWNSGLAPGNHSWIGYQMDSTNLGFNLYIANVWSVRFSTTTAFQYYQKTYGSTPLGTYTACTIAGAPAPLQMPQTIVIS